MLWVGGSIIIHSLDGLGYHKPEHLIEAFAQSIEHAVMVFPRIINWLATSMVQACLGVIVGAAGIGCVSIWRRLSFRNSCPTTRPSAGQ